MPRPKIFISYCQTDVALAGRLYEDLLAHGADVWNFERDAVPGSDAWEPILQRIRDSDFFLLLLSVAATSSRGVQEEVSAAHYARLNSTSDCPKLIPLILESDIVVPIKVARFVRLPFSLADYSSDFRLLLRALNLDVGLFSNALELEATRTTSEELDAERETLFFIRGLIESNPDVRDSFESMSQKAKSASGGRFKLGEEQIIAWRTPFHTVSFKDSGGARETEVLYLALIPLVEGYRRGYSVREQIVAKIRARQVQVFGPPVNDEHPLKSDTLTLTFEGFAQPDFLQQLA
jgi:hypothetical protein